MEESLLNKDVAERQPVLSVAAQSVVSRLEWISSGLRIVCAVAGLLGGSGGFSSLALNAMTGRNHSFGNIVVAVLMLLLGGLVGFAVGYLASTMVDWAKQMLLFQYQIAHRQKT